MVRGMPRLTLYRRRLCTGLSSLGGIIRQDVNEIFTTLEISLKTKQPVSFTFSNNRNKGNISKHYIVYFASHN